MKIVYFVILSDIEPQDINKMVLTGKMPTLIDVIKLKHKPDFMDMLKIDSLGICNTKWKHVLKMRETENEGYEIIELVTSFGKTVSNL